MSLIMDYNYDTYDVSLEIIRSRRVSFDRADFARNNLRLRNYYTCVYLYTHVSLGKLLPTEIKLQIFLAGIAALEETAH